MGARSEEALAKRAAKRNMTIEEYKAYDRAKNKEHEKKKKVDVGSSKKRKVEDDDQEDGNAKKAQRAGDAKAPAAPPSRLGDWTCPSCSFVNFATRAKCKQCGAAAPSDGERQRVLEARRRRKEEKARTVDPSRAWEGSVASQERLDDNQRLRKLYRDDPDSLSAEERARAETLLARDERKKAKKAARAPPKEALRQKRDEWRAFRREQAAARPKPAV